MQKQWIALAAAVLVIAAAAFALTRGKNSAPDEISAAESGAPPAMSGSGASSAPSTAASGAPADSASHGASPDRAAIAPLRPTAWSESQQESAALNEKLRKTPLSPKEKKAMKATMTLMGKSLGEKFSAQNYVKTLTQAGLAPVIAQDFNPYTGKMVTVRTETPPEGQRYLHTQVMEGENKEQYVQHTSVEFRPSSDGLEVAKATLAEMVKAQKLAPPEGFKLEKKSENFYAAKLVDGREAWIEVKTKETLRNDAFNAYDEIADVGTIRAAIEITPGHESGPGAVEHDEKIGSHPHSH